MSGEDQMERAESTERMHYREGLDSIDKGWIVLSQC
jgi:hypothetical protein